MELEEYTSIGSWHGGIAGAITFLGGWIYCTYQYGFLLGFGLGWLPSIILSYIVLVVVVWLWPLIDIALVVICYSIYAAVFDTKPTKQISQTPPAVARPSNLPDNKQAAEKQSALADQQPLHRKASASPLMNNIPPPQHDTAEVLAKCLIAAANAYQLPPAALIGIMEVEGGHVGEETKPDPTYLYFMGPMHISNKMIPEMARVWNVDFDTAHEWLKNDGCVNVRVAAWMLSKKVSEVGNLYQAIGLYHYDDNSSVMSAAANDYAKKVTAAMERKGLIKHDAPPPN